MRREHGIMSIPSPLPQGYSPLQYIQGTGTQYIDTGVYGTTDTQRIVIDVAWDDYSSWQAMGFANSNNGLVIRLGNIVGTGLFFTAQMTGTWVNVPCNVSAGDDWHEFDIQSGSQKFDSSQLSTNTIGGWNRNFYLFALNASWTSGSAFCKCKIKACKIYINGSLAHDYYPALRTSDSKPGLYDIIESNFKTNAGTGEFLYA